jgi:hypothetical protein
MTQCFAFHSWHSTRDEVEWREKEKRERVKVAKSRAVGFLILPTDRFSFFVFLKKTVFQNGDFEPRSFAACLLGLPTYNS